MGKNSRKISIIFEIGLKFDIKKLKVQNIDQKYWDTIMEDVRKLAKNCYKLLEINKKKLWKDTKTHVKIG